jgi:hypothetical protein
MDATRTSNKTSRLRRTTEVGLADGRACLEAALRYQALGWHVVVDCPPDHGGVGRKHAKECKHPGKAPLIAWKEFQIHPPTERQIRDWWHTWPNANVGVVLGRLVRGDVDGPDGEARLLDLSHGDLPRTLEFTTGRDNGGRGLLYCIPDGLTLRTTIEGVSAGNELRLQCLGAQTVLPPSRHSSGSFYAWKPGHGPDEIKVAMAPGWLLAALQGQTATQTRGTGKPRGARVLAAGEKQGECGRNTLLASLAGTLRRRGLEEEEIRECLLILNGSRCEPPLDENEVADIARKIAKYEPATVPAAIIRMTHGRRRGHKILRCRVEVY